MAYAGQAASGGKVAALASRSKISPPDDSPLDTATAIAHTVLPQKWLEPLPVIGICVAARLLGKSVEIA